MRDELSATAQRGRALSTFPRPVFTYRSLLFALGLGLGLSHSRPLAEARSDESLSYPLSYLERALSAAPRAHLVTQYELGQVNWSSRVLRTLGVGAHVILSPTGGLGQRDLEAVAIESARQNFERLSSEISLTSLNRERRCSSQERSRMFQTTRAQWMSDGSVHLPAVIRFEVYEPCKLDSSSKDGDVASMSAESRDQSKHSPDESAHPVQSLEASLHRGQRAVIYATLSSKGQGAQDRAVLSCLSTSPTIAGALHSPSKQNSSDTGSFEPHAWRAIRWLATTHIPERQSPQTAQEVERLAHEQVRRLKNAVKPSLDLGNLTCDRLTVTSSQRDRRDDGSQRAEVRLTVTDLNTTRANALRSLLKREGGAELWIWMR